MSNRDELLKLRSMVEALPSGLAPLPAQLYMTVLELDKRMAIIEDGLRAIVRLKESV